MSPDNSPSLYVNCPVCKRAMIIGGTCRHGAIPPPSPDAPKEIIPIPKDGGLKRKKRDDQEETGVGG